MTQTSTLIDLDKMFRNGSNSRKAAEALLDGKPWTRKDLQDQFGIQKTNVYRILKDFRDAGLEILQEGGRGGGKNADGTPNEATYRVVSPVQIASGGKTVTRTAPKAQKASTAKPKATQVKKAGTKTAHIGDVSVDLERGELGVSLTINGEQAVGGVDLSETETLRRLHDQDLAVVEIDLTGEGFRAVLVGKGGTLVVSHLTPQSV